MTRIPLALLALPLLLLATSAAHAAKQRVPQDFDTIQEAVNAAAEGDKVVIDEGRYEEAIVVATDRVKLIGKPGHEIVAPPGSGFAVLVSQSAGVQLRDLNVTAGIAAVGISIDDCDDVLVTRCNVAGGSQVGIEVVASLETSLQRNEVILVPIGISVGRAGSPELASRLTTVVANRVTGALDEAIAVEGEGSLLRRNRVTAGGTGVDAVGIRVGGDSVRLVGNVLNGFGGPDSEAGILVDGEEHFVLRNTISQGRGLLLTGSGHFVKANRIVDVEGDGIIGFADNTIIRNNRILDCGSDGLDIEAASVRILSNRVQGAGADGIELDEGASNCSAVRNKVIEADDDGFNVKSGGHTLLRNSAKDSGDFDLFSTVPESANSYSKNKFGTREFAD